MELRGLQTEKTVLSGQTGMAESLSLHQLFTSIAVRLDGSRAQEQGFIIDLYVIDREERCRLIISNGALIHRTGERARIGCSMDKADFSCALTYPQLMQELAGGRKGVLFNEEQGDRSYWDRLISLIVNPDPTFNIVTP
jgi:alkyl sulfatase BDS1-like metallo-beta-lactamase superfamily hydrolase